MKTIDTFVKPEDAHLLRMRLENAGIHAVVTDDLTAQAMPHLSTAIGGVRVLVPDDQLDDAQQFLGCDQPEAPPHTSDLVCPQCGSNDIADKLHKKRSYIMSFLILIVMMLPAPLIKLRYKCNSCGHLWK